MYLLEHEKAKNINEIIEHYCNKQKISNSNKTPYRKAINDLINAKQVIQDEEVYKLNYSYEVLKKPLVKVALKQNEYLIFDVLSNKKMGCIEFLNKFMGLGKSMTSNGIAMRGLLGGEREANKVKQLIRRLGKTLGKKAR